MNSSLFVCAIILIVLGSCLNPCQNVEEKDTKHEVVEGGEDNKHNTLLRLTREADGIEAEFIRARSKDAEKKKGKSVSKKSAEKKTASSDDKSKKKISKKHGDTMKSHKLIAINTTTTADNKNETIKDLNAGKDLSNSSKEIGEIGSGVAGAKPGSSKSADVNEDGNVDSMMVTMPPTGGPKVDAVTLDSLSGTPGPNSEQGKEVGDSEKGNTHKPVYLAVDHSDKKGDGGTQKDSSDEKKKEDEDEGPKVNVTAKDDATNITVKERSFLLSDEW